MSRWGEQFSQHGIHQSLSIALSSVYFDELETNVDAELLLELKRLRQLLKRLEFVLTKIDPVFCPVSILTTINSSLNHSNFAQPLVDFYNDDEWDALKAANDHFSSTMIMPLLELERLAELAPISHDSTAADTLFRSLADDFREELEAFSAAISTNEAASSKTGEDLAELTVSINELHNERDEWISDANNKFNQAQSDKSKQFGEWLETFGKGADNSIKVKFDQQSERLLEIMGDASKRHEAILELHQLVAGDSVAAGYLNSSKEDFKQANFWRWSSIAFILFTVAWLGAAYYFSIIGEEPSSSPWFAFARTSSLTGVLLFGAAYAARQSKSHRDQAMKANWFGLEMKALDPYIASLPNENQTALKEKLADRMFAQGGGEQNTPVSVSVEKGAVSALIDALKTFVK